MTEVQNAPAILPAHKRPSNEIAVFNNNSLGDNNPPWEPREGVTVPPDLHPSDNDLERRELTDPVHKVVELGEYVDKNSRSLFGKKQKLHTLWVHKEKMEQKPDQPVVLFFQGIGVHLGHPDMQARAWHLSHELQDSPIFMIDYPNVKDASFYTPEQAKELTHDNVMPIVKTWVEAMKKAGLEGQEVHIVGESMGGFFATEVARYLAHEAREHPDDKTLMRPTKMSLIDPAGVPVYKSFSESAAAASSVWEFSKEGKYRNSYLSKQTLSNKYVREINEYDAPPVRQFTKLGSWFINGLLRDAPPIFFNASLLAHGGLPEKLDEVMELLPDLHLTITNFTESKVCPHEEFMDMMEGPKDAEGKRSGGLKGKYKERVRTILLPGDGHAAMQVHERAVHPNKHAFREVEQPHNPELMQATRRIVDTLGKRIHDSFNTPHEASNQLDYHNLQHTSPVREGGRRILETIMNVRGTPAAERERLLVLVDIATYGHDVVQQSYFEVSTDPEYNTSVKMRKTYPGNENQSAEDVAQLMKDENERAGHEIYLPHDIDMVQVAIRTTIPEVTGVHIGQPQLTSESPPVAVALAVADLYNPYLFDGNPMVSNLFHEQNWDILERLYTDKHITDPNVQRSIKRRMDEWLAGQKAIVPDLQATLIDRLSSLSPTEREKVMGLMNFEATFEKLNAFEKRHVASRGSFDSLLTLWGYYDDPDRYNPSPNGTKLPIEIVG